MVSVRNIIVVNNDFIAFKKIVTKMSQIINFPVENFIVGKKAMIRNGFYRIPHPALNTRRKWDIDTKGGTKLKHTKS